MNIPNEQQTILVTGATGFIGRALVPVLLARGHKVIAASRYGSTDPFPSHSMLEGLPIGDLIREPDWYSLLHGVDAVVHLAARVHQRIGSSDTDEESNLRVNYYATRALARAALMQNVKRFVFVSSVQAQADVGGLSLLTEDDHLEPTDPYARTKFAAEEALRSLFSNHNDQELIVLRPTLVYGPEVRANFAALMKAVANGVPMPFGAVHNKRSILFLGNLIDAIATTLNFEGNAAGTFLLKDGPDLSIRELIVKIGDAFGRPARLIPMPVEFLKILASLAGQPGLSRRLLESLAIDDSRFRKHFDWKPPYTQEQGLKLTAEQKTLSF